VLPAVLAALVVAGATVDAAWAQETKPAEGAEAAAAAPARDPDAVVAKVGAATVTERELQIAGEAFASELANVPQEQWRSVLIDAVVNVKLLALAAEDSGLAEGPAFEAQLGFLRLQALRNLYVEQTIVNGLTDAELQEGYQNFVVKDHKAAPQVRARHILVDTKEEADKIIADLKGGAVFEELAKQSKDPSGQNGGDLGFFGEGQMVPEFEKAAFALEPGQFTQEPVQSQFGWHVIKVEEKRMSAPPALAEIETQLRSYLIRQKFETTLTALRDKYPVEIIDQPAAPAAPAPAAPAAPVPAPAAPAPAEQPKP
jgi:peptidyl-prolyl cis-trans isomerase C